MRSTSLISPTFRPHASRMRARRDRLPSTPPWTSSRADAGAIALVVGAEKMTAKPVVETSDILLSASYRKEEADIDGGFAGVFGRIAQSYFQRYGDRSEELARISAKNHRNGVSNPYAQMRRDFGFEFCNVVSDKNPYVAAPLRRTDCSLISDGAAALVVADEETAERLQRAIAFRARRARQRFPAAVAA